MPTYVIQTIVDREERVCERLQRMLAPLGARAYVPRIEVAKRWSGAWHVVQKALFPGYALLSVPDGPAGEGALRLAEGIARLVRRGDDPVPLPKGEERLLDHLLTRDEGVSRVMPASRGVIHGGRTFVTEGPLRGEERRITKIDRHKRMAVLQMSVLGEERPVRVALEIYEKVA